MMQAKLRFVAAIVILASCGIAAANDAPVAPHESKSEPEADSVHAKMRAFAEANQPEGENVWPAIERALAQLAAIKREFTPSYAIEWYAIFDREFEVQIPIDEQTLRETPIALARAMEAGVHDDVILAARSGHLLLPQGEESLAAMAYIGTSSQLRELSRFMLAVLVDAIDRNDSELAVAAFDAAMFIGSRASDHAGLIQLLVGTAIQLQALSVLQTDLISDQQIPVEMLRGWLAAIDARPLRHVRDHLRIEAEFLLADSAAFFDDDGLIPPDVQADILELIELGGDLSAIALLGMFENDEEDEARPEVPEEISRQFPTREMFETWIRTTVDRVETLLEQPPVRWSAIEPVLPDDHFFAPVIHGLAEAFTNTARSHMQRGTYRQAVRLIIALELHRREHGRYPDELAALAPAILPEVPADSFTGNPFAYRRDLADDGTDSYVLYSFGANNTDNGGVPCERVHHGWSLRDGDPECDFVFNRPWYK